MERNEYVQTLDGTIQIDAMCSMETVRKTSIFDVSNYVAIFEDLMYSLKLFDADGLRHSLEHARDFTQGICEKIVSGRRAWIHGHDVDFEIHPHQLFSAGTVSLECIVEVDRRVQNGATRIEEEIMRDLFRKSFDTDGTEHRKIRRRLLSAITELSQEVLKHMNKNPYVVHDIHVSQNSQRCVVTLTEFDDWRAMQWTSEQIEHKRAATNDN